MLNNNNSFSNKFLLLFLVSCSPGWPHTHHVVEDDLKLLPNHPASPCTTVPSVQAQALGVLDAYSTS